VPFSSGMIPSSSSIEIGLIGKGKLARLIIKTKVDNLKQSNPKHWWREVKRISGMVSHSRLQDCIQSENFEHLPLADLANAINNAFLEPMQEFDPFNPNDDQTTSMFDQPLDITTPWETYNKLKLLSTSKAPGPDDVPNFVY
jgi:hypothetical protein